MFVALKMDTAFKKHCFYSYFDSRSQVHILIKPERSNNELRISLWIFENKPNAAVMQ